MIDINKINSRLNYTEFYNMSEYNWNSFEFYRTDLMKELAKNYNFLYTFKDKINFHILYRCQKVKLKFIKNFIKYYDKHTWRSIVNLQNITPEFINKYYKQIKCPIPLKFVRDHKNKIKEYVLDYIVHHQEDFFYLYI